jgi:hypothetical protein
MKKHTTYYVIGAVLIGVGIYLYNSNNKDKKNVNLEPPMVVVEEKDGVVTTTTTETTVFTALDKLKALIDSIKSKGATTPTITT